MFEFLSRLRANGCVHLLRIPGEDVNLDIRAIEVLRWHSTGNTSIWNRPQHSLQKGPSTLRLTPAQSVNNAVRQVPELPDRHHQKCHVRFFN